MKIKKYTLICCLLIANFTTTILYAQEQQGLREQAKKLHQQFQYYKAAVLLQRVVDSKKPFLEDMELLADCYMKLKDYQAAENWYSRVIQHSKSNPENLMHYGDVLKANLKYTEAKSILQQYVSVTNNIDKVANLIAGCDSALKWISTPTKHQLKNQEKINTDRSEFAAFPYKNNIYFTAEPNHDLSRELYGRTGKTYLRIFESRVSNDGTSLAPQLDENTFNVGTYHIGPVSSNKAGNMLFVTRTTTGSVLEESELNKVKYLTNNLELFIYQFVNGNWEEKAFPYNAANKYSIGHAVLSKDENTLYFVSNMPGGFGGTDIWYSEKQSNLSWGTPVNLGANINTGGDEMFPFYGEDGFLYFSSNGWPGMGGLDIFKAEGQKNKFQKAINLAYPINSSTDDFAYVITQDDEYNLVGFMSSNRKEGKGGDDIYKFSLKKAQEKLHLAVKGTVIDRKTTLPISAVNVSLYTKSNSVLVASQSTNNNGEYFFELQKDTDYEIIARKDKFDSDKHLISTQDLKKSDTLIANLSLATLFEVGKTFTLSNIKYDFDKDVIRPDAAKILDGLVMILRDNPSLEIELGSHTDSRGADKYNLSLSQRRAQSAVNYLVSRGIARTRLIAKGYGETQLLNECEDGIPCSDEQHHANRRTVFKILKF
jgi:outer membrane protein OmpA-like peptidoglycan-associated protein/tetratricopeptide (TPR) repeat protein